MTDDIKTLREFIRGIVGPTEAGRSLSERALAALERVEKETTELNETFDRLLRTCERSQAERDSLRAKLERAKEAMADNVATLVFIKTALPVIQCMTGKIGLDLGEAKSLEMQKAADDSIYLARAVLAELSAKASAQCVMVTGRPLNDEQSEKLFDAVSDYFDSEGVNIDAPAQQTQISDESEQ